MFWSLLALIFVLFIGILEFVLDYIWHDKRTKRHKTFRVVLLIVFIGSLATSGIVVYFDKQDSKRTSAELMKQISELKKQGNNISSSSKESEEKAHKDSLVLQSQIVDLKSKLEPFVEIAKSKYPNQNIDTALEKLQKEIIETKEMAKPNTLELFAKEIKKTENGYSLILRFKPTKNIPLGIIGFSASLPINSKARILDIFPTDDSGSFHLGEKQITPEGKYAQLVYSITDMSNPMIEIKLSESTAIKIEGNNGIEPIIIEVK
jgi:hypothetical protein